MNITPFDLAKLLLISEENNNNTQNKALADAINNLSQTQKQQAVVAKSEQVTIGKKEYINVVKDRPFIASGSLFKTTKSISIKLLKLQSLKEFTNFSIYIDKQLYMQGDFAYYSKIGMAYYTPDDEMYTLEITDFDSEDGLELTIDSGLNISFYTLIATILN